MFEWALSSFQKTLQIVAHCVGSIINHAALLSGRTTGKIRNLISTQVAVNSMTGQYNELKTGIYLPEALQMLGVSGLDADESPEKLMDRLFSALAKDLGNVFISYKERCQYHVCHR